MREAQKRGYGYEKQQAYKRGAKPMGGPGKPDFKEESRKTEVKNWKNLVPRPVVVKAVRKGVKKFISKSGFTEPAVDYAKENKKITLIKKGKIVVKRTK